MSESSLPSAGTVTPTPDSTTASSPPSSGAAERGPKAKGGSRRTPTTASPESIPLALRSGGIVVYYPAENRWDVSQLKIGDLAAGLAGLPRFGNQLRNRVSDAEHSFNLYKACGEPWALLHEAGEVIGGLGDVNGRLKRVLGMEAYITAEESCLDAVSALYNIPRADIHEMDVFVGNVEYMVGHGHPEIAKVANFEESKEKSGYGVQWRIHNWDERRAAEEWLTEILPILRKAQQ